jgi:CO/xanthine dehydrogenase FAD-binding subunit
LRGQSFTQETFDRTLDSLLGQAKFRTSAHRASADYRKHIVGGLFRETFETAWKRAE